MPKRTLGFQIAVSFVAIAFLAFVGGAFVADFKWFPYKLMFSKPFAYLHAVQEQKKTEADAAAEASAPYTGPALAVPASDPHRGAYIFMTSDITRPSTALLFDMQGKVIHQWHRNFGELWRDHPDKAKPVPETAVSWRYGHLFPNGDILVVLKRHGDTPEGYGLAKLDKDSNLIWSVADNFHHQFSLADDGRIFGLAHRWRNTKEKPVKDLPQLPETILEDFVIELSPDGKELSSVSLTEAFANPEFAAYMYSAFDGGMKHRWDPLHPNDVEIINEKFAAHHPFMKPGMVLVSLRDLDALVLLDMKSGQIVWATRSVWKQQHDPDLLDNGNILLFDNRGLLYDNRDKPQANPQSRVVEFDPSSGRIVWSYTGTREHPFFSHWAAGQERLANGDTLISEDDGSRLFIVNPAGQIVWDLHIGGVRHAQYVPADYLKFQPHAPAVADSSATTQPASKMAKSEDGPSD